MEKCSCPYYPTVIVPGIGQSKVDLTNYDGTRVKCAWPLDIDGKVLTKSIAPEAAKMVLTRKTNDFCAAVKKAVRAAISPLEVNADGIPKARLQPVSYRGDSVADCTAEEKRYIYRMIPLQELGEIVGEDHLFFFAYHSFGQPYETAAQLNEYIQNVKKRTGHDKVNLVPVSLGGSIATAYFDAYGDRNDVHRVAYFVPAANGSTLLADVFDGKFDFSDPKALLSAVLDSKTIEAVLKASRFFPKDALEKAARAAVDAILESFFFNSPAMWAVLPFEKYPEEREKYLSGTGHGTLRAKTDRFYRAQSHLCELLTTQQERGVEFFSICGYDNALLPFAGSKNVNSDTVVDFKSASLGGFAAPAGERLPEEYEPVFDRCTDKTHIHVSPQHTVDVGAGLFPDSTFCFEKQVHDDTAYNDVALAICREILTNDSFKSVYSDPRFPQFNYTRNTKKIRNELLPKEKELVELDLHDHIRRELVDAADEAEDMLSQTIVHPGEAERSEARLREAVLSATPDLSK